MHFPQCVHFQPILPFPISLAHHIFPPTLKRMMLPGHRAGMTPKLGIYKTESCPWTLIAPDLGPDQTSYWLAQKRQPPLVRESEGWTSQPKNKKIGAG